MASTIRTRISRLLRIRRPKPVILMYHRVATGEMDPWELAVAPAIFKKQMRDLASLRRVLSLTEFACRHRRGNLPPDSAAITFDDGYACNALVAAPLLEALDLPATFFLVTAMLGRPEEFWSDALERVVFDPKAGGAATISAAGREVHVDLGACPEEVRNTPPWRAMVEPPRTPRQHAYLRLYHALKPMSFGLQYQAIHSLASQVGSRREPQTSHRPMTIEEASLLSQRRGLDIAGHTQTHISLPLWERDVQLKEIEESRRVCEALACRPCTSFAYPYGDTSDLTVECAAQAGLNCAVSAYPRAVAPTDHPLALPRHMIRNDSVIESLGAD